MLDLIEPLYDLWSNRDEDTEQLASKARTLLLSRISKAKTVPYEFDASQVATLLQRMHAEARESQSNDVSNVSQAINLYLTKVAPLQERRQCQGSTRRQAGRDLPRVAA